MKILFICTHNACRSILSEVITRQIAAGRIDVASAGSSPGENVHPLTLEHLRKHGYDAAGLYSKSLEAVREFDPDIVVTVCDSAAGETCPVWLGKAIKTHWSLPDPSGAGGASREKADAFAAVMATIETRTRRLLEHQFELLNTEQLKKILTDIGNRD